MSYNKFDLLPASLRVGAKALIDKTVKEVLEETEETYEFEFGYGRIGEPIEMYLYEGGHQFAKLDFLTLEELVEFVALAKDHGFEAMDYSQQVLAWWEELVELRGKHGQ